MKHYNLLNKYKLNDFEDPQLQSIGRRNSRPTFIAETSLKHALKYNFRNKENTTKINEGWKFKFFENPFKILKQDMQPNNYNGFQNIEVPLPWQLANYDKMHYSDVWWTFPITPPKVGTANPTGLYKKELIFKEVSKKKDYILRFNAGDSCIKLFLNNRMVGMSKGSRYISEFNINKYIQPGKNYITVICYKWSDGSYLEDQDQWWFSGLYRNVELVEESKDFIEDLFIKTKRLGKEKYNLEINLSLKTKQNIVFKLFDKQNKLIFSENSNEKIIKLKQTISDIKEWSSEDPNLYTLVITNSSWYSPTRIGFREIKTSGRKILINGKKVMFKGVNMHSHDPKTGKYVPLESLEQDLKLMKRHNINAIRTAHYPQSSEFYDLCDELGFYVIDEADLEAHGFELTGDWSWTSNDPQFKKAYVERGTRMVHQDKNHPSVVMWSLGNETGWGPNFVHMAKAIRKIDDTRLLHYEGDFRCEEVDVHSNMYTRLEESPEEFGRRDLKAVLSGKVANGEEYPEWLKKPHIECEFAHSMGNGPGSLQDYFDIFYSNEAFNGGFVWEWYDHGIYTKNKKGDYYKYGGDFGDDPTNGPFCIDGLQMPNKQPSPGLIELKEVIAPINTKLSKNKDYLEIENRYDISDFTFLQFDLAIIDSTGKIITNQFLSIQDLQARKKTKIKIPTFEKENNKYYFVNLITSLNSNTNYALKGHIISIKQHELPASILPIEPNSSKFDLQISEDELIYNISNANISLDVDKSTGRIYNFIKHRKKIFSEGPKLNFWRGITDNDADQYKEIWMKQFFVHLFSETLLELRVEKISNYVEISCKTINGAVNQAWYFLSKYIYKIYSDGEVEIKVSGKPSGLIELDAKKYKGAGSGSSLAIDPENIFPKMLPRIGLKFKLQKDYNNFKYFGKGPGETYSDSCSANPYNLYEQNVDEAFTNYVHPQENGNKFKTLWVKFHNKRKSDITISSLSKNTRFDFSVSWYDDMDITSAKHTIDLVKRNYLTLNIDYKQNGLGSNSCGPPQMKKYRCEFKKFNIHFTIK